MWKKGLNDESLRRIKGDYAAIMRARERENDTAETKYETILNGFTEIEGNMIAKVQVLKDGDVIDGAWGTWDAVLAWCDESNYPPPDGSQFKPQV